MPAKNDDASENLRPYKNKKSILKEQEMEVDYRDLIDKSSDTKNRARNNLSEYTPQARFFISKSSSSLKKVRFSK